MLEKFKEHLAAPYASLPTLMYLKFLYYRTLNNVLELLYYFFNFTRSRGVDSQKVRSEDEAI